MRAPALAGLTAVLALGTSVSFAQPDATAAAPGASGSAPSASATPPGAPPPAASGSASGAPAGSASAAPAPSAGAPADPPTEGAIGAPAAGAVPEPPPQPSAPAPSEAPAEAAPAPAPSQAPEPDGEPPPPEVTFGLSMDLGAGARLEGTSEGYQDAAPGGVAVALGAWFAPSRVLELGLVGQRAQLGLERSAPVGRSVTVERYAYSAWLAARAFPLRSDTLGLFVQLGLGGSWQSVDVTGTRGAGFVTSAVGYACSTSDGPALALGAGLGLDAAIRREVALVAGVDVGAHQLSGDELGGCGPGAGTATLLTGRVGFVWRFDLAGSAEGAAGR